MYTADQQKKIGALVNSIEHRECPMAVVDYLGQQRLDLDALRFVEITEDDLDRFGVRDLHHVKAYNFPVVCLNKVGRRRRLRWGS